MYPSNFESLIALFEKLPGVGSKTAQRYAFALLEKDSETIDEIADTVKKIKNVRRCKTCGFLSDEDECPFCKDTTRNRSQIMVVAYAQDVVAIEKTGSYKGMYHVLNGLVSSSKGIFPEDINIDSLLKILSEVGYF